jgi:purine-binding chemotaxis protein CheW
LLLRLGERLVALRLACVREVFRMVAMAARLPRAPRHCLGVVDCRGTLVPVFDLAGRLGLCAPRREKELCDGHVLTLEDSLGLVGYAVDEVRELSDEPPRALEGAGAAALGRLTLGAVRGRDGRLAPLLDETQLLTVLARQQLRAALAALSSGAGG